MSIVNEKCEKATNNLRVIYDLPTEEEPKKKFAVCVKGLDFPDDDLSLKMIEWIEVLSAMGADKIFLYKLNVHENVEKVSLVNSRIWKEEMYIASDFITLSV